MSFDGGLLAPRRVGQMCSVSNWPVASVSCISGRVGVRGSCSRGPTLSGLNRVSLLPDISRRISPLTESPWAVSSYEVFTVSRSVAGPVLGPVFWPSPGRAASSTTTAVSGRGLPRATLSTRASDYERPWTATTRHPTATRTRADLERPTPTTVRPSTPWPSATTWGVWATTVSHYDPTPPASTSSPTHASRHLLPGVSRGLFIPSSQDWGHKGRSPFRENTVVVLGSFD